MNVPRVQARGKAHYTVVELPMTIACLAWLGGQGSFSMGVSIGGPCGAQARWTMNCSTEGWREAKFSPQSSFVN